ncbi:MAG TPA: aminotransferase class V-fold PLP-dependent enzyme [Stellaceae bacterium]|nr:aminotransferase class V-fold PLP-dependent enzyme [Stellaceae bacterium]
MKNQPPGHTGRHFLQIPGPTNVPDRVLHAIAFPTIDHRSPEFGDLGKEVVAGMKRVFQTKGTVVIYPSSGTGAWEAALVNTMSPGDRVLMFETGHFASLWRQMATKLGLEIEFVPGDWRRGVDGAQVAEKLAADREHRIKAVCVVHNETSTGVTTRIPEIRAAIDEAKHPALLMVDTISSLASIDYRHDEWGVDVTVAGSQKGLMLPPGLGFNAVSDKAIAAAKTAKMTRSYWDWQAMSESGQTGFFPYTPATNLLYGLREALTMLLDEEGLPAVFARHSRHAEATRRAVTGWGLEVLCADPREYSGSLTAVLVPNGYDADRIREIILDGFDMSLGTGLGKLKGKIFRIGHLGHFNDLMLCGTLCGVEMGLHRAGIPHRAGGVAAALEFLGALDHAH